MSNSAKKSVVFFVIVGLTISVFIANRNRKNDALEKICKESVEEPLIIQTMERWNLAHPFLGTKNNSDHILSLFLHSSLGWEIHDRGDRVGLEFRQTDQTGGKKLLHLEFADGRDEGLRNGIGTTLKVMKDVRYPLEPMFRTLPGNSTSSRIIFKNIHRETGTNSNIVKTPVQMLPILYEEWRPTGSYLPEYGDESSIRTWGSFLFPSFENNKFPKNKLNLCPKPGKGINRPIQLSFTPHTKEDLKRDFDSDTLSNGLIDTGGHSPIIIDVPYTNLANSVWKGSLLGGESLKMLCPNYFNPKVAQLFSNFGLRKILQDAANLAYYRIENNNENNYDLKRIPDNTVSVGLHSSVKSFDDDSENVDIKSRFDDLKSDWDKVATQLQSQLDGINYDIRKDTASGIPRLTHKLSPIEIDLLRLVVHNAASLPDHNFNKEFETIIGEQISDPSGQLLGLGILDLDQPGNVIGYTAKELSRFIHMGEHLPRDVEFITFDLPIPDGGHIEAIFAPKNRDNEGRHANFFGLLANGHPSGYKGNDEGIAPDVMKFVKGLMQGESQPLISKDKRKIFPEHFTAELLAALRAELPCIFLGRHNYYAYTKIGALPRNPKGGMSNISTTGASIIKAVSQPITGNNK